jgi:hypothetical protein
MTFLYLSANTCVIPFPVRLRRKKWDLVCSLNQIPNQVRDDNPTKSISIMNLLIQLEFRI